MLDALLVYPRRTSILLGLLYRRVLAHLFVVPLRQSLAFPAMSSRSGGGPGRSVSNRLPRAPACPLHRAMQPKEVPLRHRLPARRLQLEVSTSVECFGQPAYRREAGC